MWTEPEIGDLCRQRPLALPVIDRLGGDDDVAVLAELSADEATLAAPWRDRGLPALLDHIVESYHRAFDRELQTVEQALSTIWPPAGSPRHAAWARLRHQLAELRTDMELHMTKEERVLFPWLRGHAATAAAPIRAMQLEHTDTITLLQAIHAGVRRGLAPLPRKPHETAVATAVEYLERRLCEHLHLETNELFRRALE